MTPKVVRGRSFKGVGKYLLHDKAAQSNDRVTFTETLNLPTANANSAIRHMIDTAAHADELKRMAGVSLRGQKQQRPVYHYSLAWHPSENVTMDVMIDAAKESLQALGIDDRQALIVGHNDTKHPHVHVVVNLVSQENGKFPKLGNDFLKFSEWALEYEKRRGVVFCKEREANQEKRKAEYVKSGCMDRAEWMAWKKGQTADLWATYRKDRDEARADRKGQYDALWREKEERFAERKADLKQLYKPMWRDMLRRQEDQLKEFDAGAVGRLRVAARTGGIDGVRGFARAIFNGKKARAELVLFHIGERKDLGTKQRAKVRDASREITQAWQYRRDKLKTSHREQDAMRLDETKAKSKAIWQEKPQPQTREQAHDAQHNFDQHADRRRSENKQRRDSLKAFSDGDKSYIEEAREAQKKQREKNRKRNRSRGRNRDDGGRTMT